MTSASENTIGDQRAECGEVPAVDAGEHDLGPGASRLISEATKTP